MKTDYTERWIQAGGERTYRHVLWYRRLLFGSFGLMMLFLISIGVAFATEADIDPWIAFGVLGVYAAAAGAAAWQSIVAQLAAGEFLHLSRRDTWRLNIRNIVVFEDSVARLGATSQRPATVAPADLETAAASGITSTDHAEEMRRFDAYVPRRLGAVNRLMLSAIVVLVVGLVVGGILAAVRIPLAGVFPAIATVLSTLAWAVGTVLRTRIIRWVVREFELTPRQGRGLKLVTVRGMRASLLTQLDLGAEAADQPR